MVLATPPLAEGSLEGSRHRLTQKTPTRLEFSGVLLEFFLEFFGNLSPLFQRAYPRFFEPAHTSPELIAFMIENRLVKGLGVLPSQ